MEGAISSFASDDDTEQKTFLEDSLSGLRPRLEVLRVELERKRDTDVVREVQAAKEERRVWEEQLRYDWSTRREQLLAEMETKFEAFVKKHQFREANEQKLLKHCDSQLREVKAAIDSMDNPTSSVEELWKLRQECRTLAATGVSSVKPKTHKLPLLSVKVSLTLTASEMSGSIEFKDPKPASSRKQIMWPEFSDDEEQSDSDKSPGTVNLERREILHKVLKNMQSDLQPDKGIPIEKHWKSKLVPFIDGRQTDDLDPIENLKQFDGPVGVNVSYYTFDRETFLTVRNMIGEVNPQSYTTKTTRDFDYLIEKGRNPKRFVRFATCTDDRYVCIYRPSIEGDTLKNLPESMKTSCNGFISIDLSMKDVLSLFVLIEKGSDSLKKVPATEILINSKIAKESWRVSLDMTVKEVLRHAHTEMDYRKSGLQRALLLELEP